jgi:hypothetical protein
MAAAVMAIGVLLMRDSLRLWAVGAGMALYLVASYVVGVWSFQEIKSLSRTMARGIAR